MNKLIKIVGLSILMMGSALAMDRMQDCAGQGARWGTVIDLGEELRGAAMIGDVNQVKDLLAKGVPVDAKANYNFAMTPLMNAACFGRVDICRLLLDHGADINAKRANWKTSLMLAAHNYDHDGRKEVCQFLIRRMIWPTKQEINSLVGLIGSLKRMKTTALNQDMKRLMPQMLFNDIKQSKKLQVCEQIMKSENFTAQNELLDYLNSL